MTQPAEAPAEARDRDARQQAPVGVFDSGVGGLTVLRELLRELPDERFIYFGDTGNCPYGVRPEAQIQELALAVARFLLPPDVKPLLAPSNPASPPAPPRLRPPSPPPFP